MKTRLSFVLALSLVFLPMFFACNQGPEKVKIQPQKRAGYGESCRVRSDCKKELHCIENRCIKAEYDISKTSQECHLVECTRRSHCCRDVEADETCNRRCEDNVCVSYRACETDEDCFDGRCVGGECVACVRDDDCPGDQRCTDDNTCEERCRVDSNCPMFHACRSGRCVEVGCQSDRECVLFTGNGEAFCKDEDKQNKKGTCIEPCHNDRDCNGRGLSRPSPAPGLDAGGLGGRQRRTRTSGEFYVCKEKRCVFVGCKKDSECRAAAGVANTERPVEAVCGEPGGSVTLPPVEDPGGSDAGDAGFTPRRDGGFTPRRDGSGPFDPMRDGS